MRCRLAVIERRDGLSLRGILRVGSWRVGGSCPQHTALSAADKAAIAAKRMVEVLHANGIYSSPIVTTIMIKAYDEKGASILKVQSKFPAQALVRKRAAEGS